MNLPAHRPRRRQRSSPAVRSIVATPLVAIAPGLLPAQVAPAPTYAAKFDVVTLPDGWNLGEIAAVALDESEHLYVFHRGPHPLLEFTPDGRLIGFPTEEECFSVLP